MRLLWTTLLLLFVTAMVTVISLKNMGLADPFFKFFAQLPFHDKIGHFVLMGILGFLAVGAIAPRLPLPRKTATWRTLGVLISIIALEELSQGFLAQRTLSLSDFLFGAAGAVTCGWLAHAIHSRPEIQRQR